MRIAIRSGTHLLAGTDSRVWIQVMGDRRTTPWLRLEPERGEFARNDVTEFELELIAALDPGRPQGVQLFHDASGRFKGWYVDKVVIDETTFPFDCWLARDEAPYRTDAASLPEDAGRAYTVRIQTTDAFLAGTDAAVYVQLIGEHATTPWMRLWEPGVDNFEQGNSDAFRLFAQDIGDIHGVWLRHDNTGMAPGWHVESLQVDDLHITVDRWLATDEGDGSLDFLWRARPLIRPKQPLRFRLVTFADIHKKARWAASADVGFLGVMLSRYGIDVELNTDDNEDILLGPSWLAFDARYPTSDSLVEGLIGTLGERSKQLSEKREIPLFYFGGFEDKRGFYPDLAQRPGGIFMPVAAHPEATLPHELGRFFGLGLTASNRVDPRDADGALAVRDINNPPDVIEHDPHNPMSSSDLRAAYQFFTWGQVERMVLALIEYIA